MICLKRLRDVFAGSSFRQVVYPCVFAVGFLLFLGTDDSYGTEPQNGKPASVSTPINEDSSQQPSKGLQFMGLVDVGERHLIALLPGESVDAYYSQQGEHVKKGQPVLKLNSDVIMNGLADLIIKKNKVKEGIQQLEIAELEKRQKEKQLQRVDAKIDTEKSLKNQIAGYSSPVLQQLETQRLTLLEQIEISSVRLAALKENNTDNDMLLKMIKNQLDDFELRKQNLTVKAPFDARVFFLNPNPGRLTPGNLVCELRNETFYLVRGKIIQHQRNLIKVGDIVKVSLESSPKDTVNGAVQSIEYMQEHREMQGYSSFETIVRIDDKAKWLQAGMMVSISRDGGSSQGKN
jgi:multidrug efflux pump subunit AcrA (membrane-fusion protein)